MKSREVHQFGPFRFDPAQYELREGDRRTTLPPALNKLLLLLVSRPGELVTREEIAATLWEQQQTVNITPGINMAIKRLRTQIGDNNGHGVFIETVIGAGYRFVAPVSAFSLPVSTVTPPPAVESDAPDGSVTTPPADVEPPTSTAPIEQAPAAVLQSAPGRTESTKPGRSLWLWIAVCLLLLGTAAWLVRASRRTAQQSARIDLIHLDAQDGHQLTDDEPEDRPTAQAISPGGTYVAYADRARLTLTTLATGQHRQLNVPANLTINQITWFPDESSLLIDGFTHNAGGTPENTPTGLPHLWRVSLNSQPAHLFLEDAATQAAVSPDGSRVAYLHPARDEIWIADANGHSSGKLLVAPEGEIFQCLLWSATGNAILAVAHSGRLPALAGSDLAPATSDAGTSDDESFSYEGYSAQSGAGLYRRRGVHFDSAAMLRDGTLLFPVNSSSSPASIAAARSDPSTGALLSMPHLIPSQQALKVTVSGITALSASSDGRSIAAIVRRSTTNVLTADFVPGDSPGQSPKLTHEQRLTHRTGTTYPTAWLPDGSGVIFDDGIGGPIAIKAQSLGRSEVRTLAETSSPTEKFAQGRVSPDGNWLVFLNLDRQTSRLNAIERVPIRGGTAEVVPTRGQVKDFRCSTSKAGQCVLREVEGKSDIVYYTLDPVRGMGRELARTAWQPTILGDWSVSPDGTTVARANHDRDHPAIELIALDHGTSGISGLTPIRSIAVPDFGVILAPNWASDGHGFFVETYTDSTYNLLSVKMNGRATLLQQSSGLIWAIPSPNGEKIALPDFNPSEKEVWVASFFARTHGTQSP